MFNLKAFSQKNVKQWTVVIDPGHGGNDPGAIGKFTYEKDLALKISFKVGEFINKYLTDVRVIYTRDKDMFLGLQERADIANKNHADLFICIHCNANVSTGPFGSSTYVMGLSKADENLAVAKFENNVILLEENYQVKYESYDAQSPESNILQSLQQAAFTDQSLDFARKVQDQFRINGRRHDLGVKQANLYVLWTTSMPSVLIETGFITNAVEEQFLASDYGQQVIAASIFRAFYEYKVQVESRTDDAASNAQIIGSSSRSNQNPLTKIHTPQNNPTTNINTNTNKSTPQTNNTNKNTTANNQSTTNKKTNASTSTNKPNTNVQSNTNNQSNTSANKTTTQQNVVFKIQVGASDKKIPLNAANFKGITGVEETIVGGVYKYVAGNCATFDQAIVLQQDIRKKIPDAFVVAFANGQRISVDEAKKILNNQKK